MAHIPKRDTEANYIQHATYTGAQVDALGRRMIEQGALIQDGPEDKFLAQFDSYDTGYSHGWYEFDAVGFTLDMPVDFDAPVEVS